MMEESLASYGTRVTCTKYRIELKYPRNIMMTIAGGYPEIRGGTKWIGTKGWVWVERGAFEASNEEWRDYRNLPEDLRKVKLYVSNDHHRNFLDCVKSRKPTIDDPEASGLLSRKFRPPWKL